MLFFPEAFSGNLLDAGEILFQSSCNDIIHRILPVQDELTHSLAFDTMMIFAE